MAKQAASPAATGPGGEHFEAKVGAFYLLATLLDAEPRGLPGAHIQRIQLQGSGDGFPLDDVIVHATSFIGAPAVLEIQVKRNVTFSPSDEPFRSVVGQIADVLRAGKLDVIGSHSLAIATAQTSRQIEGSYQQVLLWARHSGSPDAFFRRVDRRGASNENMRTFVTTLQTHLARFGARSDAVAVWNVLRSLNILVFDFSAEQGQTESLVRERCAQALEPSEREKAGSLWSALTQIAQEVATVGGDIDAATLRNSLASSYGLRLAGSRSSRAARAALYEASQSALQDVGNSIGGMRQEPSAFPAIRSAASSRSAYCLLNGLCRTRRTKSAQATCIPKSFARLSPGRDARVAPNLQRHSKGRIEKRNYCGAAGVLARGERIGCGKPPFLVSRPGAVLGGVSCRCRSMSNRNDADVLIVGAGPVGLTLAIDLAQRGVSFPG